MRIDDARRERVHVSDLRDGARQHRARTLANGNLGCQRFVEAIHAGFLHPPQRILHAAGREDVDELRLREADL